MSSCCDKRSHGDCPFVRQILLGTTKHLLKKMLKYCKNPVLVEYTPPKKTKTEGYVYTDY